MKLPEYRTNSEISIKIGLDAVYILPVGAFVRPIDLKYIPKHVLESHMAKSRNLEKDGFYYTRYGIVVLANDKVAKL